MAMTRPAMLLAACALVSACATRPLPNRQIASITVSDWRTLATAADRDRLRRWRDAWVTALAQARASGRGPEVVGQAALFDPDRALTDPAPPPGTYRCRVFKLGTQRGGPLAYIAYPYFTCTIDREGAMLSLYKQTGSQRPVGLVFEDSATRAAFLGTLVLGDETAPLQYGQDAARDMAGWVERVGDRRWRLALPYPAFESVLDVIELVPAD